MPKNGQKTITFPEWVVNLAESEFKEKKEKYVALGIKSYSRLVALWIVEHSH